MSGHEQLAQDAGITVYFAHPHSQWGRGSNENTNGLLRQYLPKGLIYPATRIQIWMRLLGN
jgi:IS30 family transposase